MFTLGFTVFYYLNKMYFPSIVMAVSGKESAFFELDQKGRNEYHSRNVADFHSYISAPLAVYACFFACDNPNENIFSSYECIMKPQRS